MTSIPHKCDHTSGDQGLSRWQSFELIDLFTDTAATLNELDLRTIMGCPGGISTIRYTRISIYARFSGQFFFKFFLEKDCNGKKGRCALLRCNNDLLFSREI